MSNKPTPWKLDRPYDPDQRADALKRRFARYRRRTGAVGSGRPARFWPVWLLVAIAALAAVSLAG